MGEVLGPHDESLRPNRRDDRFRAKIDAAARRHGVRVYAHGHVVFVEKDGKSEVLCLPVVEKRFWHETWLALREHTGEKARGLEAVGELFWDPRRHELTVLASTLVGGALLAMGLWAFLACVDAMLAGRQYAGAGGTSTRSVGNRMPAVWGAPVSLILVMGGVGTIWAGLATAYPSLGEQRWVRWLLAVIFGALLLLFVLLVLYAILARLLR